MVTARMRYGQNTLFRQKRWALLGRISSALEFALNVTDDREGYFLPIHNSEYQEKSCERLRLSLVRWREHASHLIYNK
jgi:hypothetical protein